jgi:hypothetical protein
MRRMPLCLNVLLGEAFLSSGASVRYSFAADNDDTLAAYAQVPLIFKSLYCTAVYIRIVNRKKKQVI